MPEIGRREFLKVCAVLLPPMLFLPTQVHVESIFPEGWIKPAIYEDGWWKRDGVWSSNNWGPIFERTALTTGLPRIHDDFWGAWVLDRARENLNGLPEGSTDLIQRQATHKANVIMANRKDTESFAGYCPWLAVTQTLDVRPTAFEGENLAGQDDVSKIIQLREQVYQIYHAGSRLVQITLNPQFLVDQYVKGAPIIVDAPAGMGRGNWFRSIAGVREDGRQLWVTNFGSENIPLELRQINFAYIAYPANSPDSLFAPQINRDTAFWRYKLVNKALMGSVIPE